MFGRLDFERRPAMSISGTLYVVHPLMEVMLTSHAALAVESALNSGGMNAMLYGGTLTGTYADFVFVAEASDGTYLTIQFEPFWLSIEGYASSDAYGAEVLAALNSGGYPTITYSGPDPDSVYGNTFLSDSGATITVTTGWPS